MWAFLIILAYILQGGSATFGKLCGKSGLLDSCLGCGTLGGGLAASKLGCLAGYCSPSLGTASLGLPSYLPILTTYTSHVPVFKTYYKPVLKTHLTKIPILKNKLKLLLSKFPCLKKKLCLPGLVTCPLAKLSCLKKAYLKKKLLKPSCCYPLCSLC